MSAQRTQQKRSQKQNKNPLQSELGNTTIQDSVVSKIAAIAAQEVEGVRMGGSASQAVGGVPTLSPAAGAAAARPRVSRWRSARKRRPST